MTTGEIDPETTGTDRWTKGGAAPGEDPRDTEEAATDPDVAEHLATERSITHEELPDAEAKKAGEQMGTTSTTVDPSDPPGR